MTSKHHKWQLRWRVDRALQLAQHDTGLVYRVSADARAPLGLALQLVDCDAAVAALGRQHGPHNLPPMLRRLEREARELYSTPPRGDRHA